MKSEALHMMATRWFDTNRKGYLPSEVDSLASVLHEAFSMGQASEVEKNNSDFKAGWDDAVERMFSVLAERFKFDLSRETQSTSKTHQGVCYFCRTTKSISRISSCCSDCIKGHGDEPSALGKIAIVLKTFNASIVGPDAYLYSSYVADGFTKLDRYKREVQELNKCIAPMRSELHELKCQAELRNELYLTTTDCVPITTMTKQTI